LDSHRSDSTMPPPGQVQSPAAEGRRLSQARAHPAAYPHHAVAVPCCPCLPIGPPSNPLRGWTGRICAVNATKGGEPQLRERTPRAAMRVQRGGVVMLATPHPIPQCERGDAGQQERREYQSPRRERRRARRRTRARPQLTGEVAAHQRIGTGGVAADAVGAESGAALRRCGAGAALGEGGRGGCRGDCRRGGCGVRGGGGVRCSCGARRSRGARGRCGRSCGGSGCRGECRAAIRTGDSGIATESRIEGVAHETRPRPTGVTVTRRIAAAAWELYA
jgi:hypothetical protein